MQPEITVIIPTLNEGPQIGPTLEACRAGEATEVFVVDGGSTDNTVEEAAHRGATIFSSARPGRGIQLNLGAERASGDILLFLHADTLLPVSFPLDVVRTLSANDVVAGAFRLKIAGPGRSLRIIERGAQLRSRLLQLPYGDQALFLRKRTFQQVGGFREPLFMEDFDLVRRLKKIGSIGLAESAVITSARRWQRMGPWKTTLINQVVIAFYLAGFSAETIVQLYRSAQKASRTRSKKGAKS